MGTCLPLHGAARCCTVLQVPVGPEDYVAVAGASSDGAGPAQGWQAVGVAAHIGGDLGALRPRHAERLRAALGDGDETTRWLDWLAYLRRQMLQAGLVVKSGSDR